MADAIHVLEVFHSMDCGGAENMVMNLCRRMDPEKVQMDFLVHNPKEGFFDEEIRARGGRIFVMPYFKVTNQSSYQKALDSFFEAHPEIRVVHGHVGSCAHLYLKAAKKAGCYTIAHSHNTRKKMSPRQMAFRLFSYQTRRTADYFMACGKAAGEYLFGSRIAKDETRYTILRNAIDTEKYIFDEGKRRKVREEFQVGDGLLFGHVGRFDYQKNHPFLLQIFAAVHTLLPDAKLLLVGEGAGKEEMVQMVREQGLEQSVIFAGLRKDVPELLMGMDCMVFPSHNEGLPVTVIEAQAAGLPVLMSDVITDEVKLTGLVETMSLERSPSEWAGRAVRLAGTPHRDCRQQIVDAGYDIGTTARWLTAFYQKAYQMALQKEGQRHKG